MSDEKKSIPTKIDDPDRMALNEKFMEMAAMKNGAQAMEQKIQSLKLEIELWSRQMETINQNGAALQVAFDKMATEVKERYGIPAHWEIDTKAGTVAPPKPAAQGQMPVK